MGVVCVLQYRVPDNNSGQQTADMLQKRLGDLGATKTGNFTIDCEMYQSKLPGNQRTVNILHNSENPASCFAVLDSGTCLVADNLFDLLMNKLKDFYVAHTVRMESKGQRYELGDFVVKIGSTVAGQHFKGILVEVEYCPCIIPKDCWALMKEFMQGFLGSSMESEPAHFKNKMDGIYTPADTVLQYLEHFNAFRKSVVPGSR